MFERVNCCSAGAQWREFVDSTLYIYVPEKQSITLSAFHGRACVVCSFLSVVITKKITRFAQ
jgi:hypothetical protein